MGGHGKLGNNNMKRRAYGVMLILVFGAALFGVMLFQRFRERHIFNLLVKQKDHHLYSLQLLLQKEKDHTNELKRKMLGTKSRMYSLRNQKLQLDSRILEMQTTIESLQDENRAIKLRLEEKQNEISMLTDKEAESSKEVNSQSVALTEILKQKEAEIEDLKNQLKYPVKVLSINKDDLSVPSVNLTGSEISRNQKSKFESEKSTESEGANEKEKNGEDSEIVKTGNDDADRREMREEKLHMSERSQENGLQGGVDAENTAENGSSDKKETVNQETGNVRVKKREISKFLQKIGTVSQNAAHSRSRRRHGNLSNTRGRIIAKNRIAGNQNSKSSRFSETDNEGFNGLIDDHLNVSEEKREVDLNEILKENGEKSGEDDNGSKNFTINVRKQKHEDGHVVETMEQEKSDIDTVNELKLKNSTAKEEPHDLQVVDDYQSNTIATDGELSVEQSSEIEDNRSNEIKMETGTSEI